MYRQTLRAALAYTAQVSPIIEAYMRDKPEGKVHHTLKLTRSFHHLLVWLIWVINPPGTCSRSLCLY